mmetsp:Transcript_12796/g.42239  ORF Transcript_12796/g.42239 Transcript_12796/m.42239 type:complete len:423 (+) Transcript_12796:76-1344(+)
MRALRISACAADPCPRSRRRPNTFSSTSRPERDEPSPTPASSETAPASDSLALTRRGVGAAAVSAAAALSLRPEPAHSALNLPKTNLPRSPEAALRRSIPIVSPEVEKVQGKLEEVAFFLRIPQRKPWGQMQGNVDASRETLKASPEAILSFVPAADRPAALALTESLQQDLTRMTEAIGLRDPDRTSIRTAQALEHVAELEMLQVPDLPYVLPKQYRERPRLIGRATAEAVLERPGGSFGLIAGEEAKTISLTLTLDGYNAPLTAGNFLTLVKSGAYDGCTLAAGDFSLFATAKASAAATAEPPLPLEFRALGEFEPRYKLPLNVEGAEELPQLPLSVPGAVAMGRSATDGFSSSESFFFYLFDRRNSGLGGLSFDEGSFSVFGYVTGGVAELAKLRGGDRIRSFRITSGEDKLVLPAPQA